MQRAARRATKQASDVGLDAAIVAIDPQTGEIRALAHGGDAARSAFNVALDGRRQPGSTFKPFMLASAYEAGRSPRSAVTSAPFDKTYPDGTRFRVKNGGGYSGRTTLERATWQSDNSAFARLQDELGIASAIDVAERAGIRTPIDAVPAAVLGGLSTGFTPVELATAYATFANHGVRVTSADGGGARLIDTVREPGVARAWRPLMQRNRAFERSVADDVTDTLKGVITRGTATSADIDRPAAGKTGTTEEYRDAWFVGYTPDLVVAVWVGNMDAATPMKTQNGGQPVTGGSIPAAIWREFMLDALDSRPERSFKLKVSTDADRDRRAAKARPAQQDLSTPTEPATKAAPTMPDLIGLSYEDAVSALEALELNLRIQKLDQPTTTPKLDGRVINSRPAATAALGEGDQITLTVAYDPFSN
jgi:penicillin-binding protein 1A